MPRSPMSDVERVELGGPSRRDVLAVAAGLAVAPLLADRVVEPAAASRGDNAVLITLRVNSKDHALELEPRSRCWTRCAAAAVANAVYHATGKRICGLPITLDKLL